MRVHDFGLQNRYQFCKRLVLGAIASRASFDDCDRDTEHPEARDKGMVVAVAGLQYGSHVCAVGVLPRREHYHDAFKTALLSGRENMEYRWPINHQLKLKDRCTLAQPKRKHSTPDFLTSSIKIQLIAMFADRHGTLYGGNRVKMW